MPLGLAVVMPLVSFAVAIAVERGAFTRRVWTLVVGLQAILLASALLGTWTGERAGQQSGASVGEALVEHHEEAGEAFAWTAGVVLAIAALALIPIDRSAKWMRRATVIGTLVALGIAFWAGHSGGVLVFTHGVSVKRSIGKATEKGGW